MNKNVLIVFSSIVILGMFIYVQSQNEKKTKKKEAEPVASLSAAKELLVDLGRQLTNLQVKISEHSEKLGGIFSKWKKEGKIQHAGQWNQTKSNIQKLASVLKIMANNRDLVEKLRRNEELFKILANLYKESQDKISNVQGTIPQIMSLSALYGKSIATDKVLDKIENMLKPPEKAPEYLEGVPSSPLEESPYTYETPPFEDYGFESEYTSEESPAFDEFGLDDYDFGFGF